MEYLHWLLNVQGSKGYPVVCGTADGIANILEVGITKMGDAADITGTSTMFFASADQPAPPKSTVIFTAELDIPDVPYAFWSFYSEHL